MKGKRTFQNKLCQSREVVVFHLGSLGHPEILKFILSISARSSLGKFMTSYSAYGKSTGPTPSIETDPVGEKLTWLINWLMVPQDFSVFVFLYFVLNTSFLNSTMAAALNLAERHYQGIFCRSTGSTSNGRLGLSGLAILLSLWVSCFTRWLSGASEFLICPQMEATTYKDTYTAGVMGVH